MASPESTPPPEWGREILTNARSIYLYHLHLPERELAADLKGLVTGIRNHSRVLFLDLRDATESIQLVFQFPYATVEGLARAARIKRKDRLHVSGTVGLTAAPHNTLSVFVTDFKTMLPATADEKIGDPDQRGLSTQFFLARLRAGGTAYFREANFVEFEPSYISLGPTYSHIETLRVLYPGFGSPARLAASPAPQLMEAILITGNPRVFCVSRCFSPTFRDGYTSSESMILSAMQINASVDDLCHLTEGALKHIFADFTTMPNSENTWLGHDRWTVTKHSWPFPSAPVSVPEFQLAELPDATFGGKPSAPAFRACWPPNLVLACKFSSNILENFAKN